QADPDADTPAARRYRRGTPASRQLPVRPPSEPGSHRGGEGDARPLRKYRVRRPFRAGHRPIGRSRLRRGVWRRARLVRPAVHRGDGPVHGGTRPLKESRVAGPQSLSSLRQYGTRLTASLGSFQLRRTYLRIAFIARLSAPPYTEVVPRAGAARCWAH